MFLMNKTLLIIPAYNEEDSIKEVIRELKEFQTSNKDVDFIVVNDGSTDRTVEICRSEKVKLIDLPINLGLTGAFETGMKYAQMKSYDIAIQFDADGQHSSESIPLLITEVNSGNDIVIGSRFVEKKKNFSLRMIGSYFISFAIKITTGKKIEDPTSGLRAFNKKMIEIYLKTPNMTPEPDTISYFLKNNVAIKEVQTTMRDRIGGESYLTFSKSIKYMLRMTISILILQFFRKKYD